jgi:hypothetical protein
MHELTLFIPGMLSLVHGIADHDVPSVPSLEHLFACGRHEKSLNKGFSETLFMLFGIVPLTGQDLPVAAITHSIDDDQSLAGIWMRADPIHLTVDADGVALMDASTFTLDQHDALVLAADIKELLAERGYSLQAPTTKRWYLKLDKKPNIRTTAIHEVAGKNIYQHMPFGDDESDWSLLMNEVQMCLHTSQINEERQHRNEVPVNSIWFWGSGTLPESVDCQWSKVFSDEEIAQGLAKNADIPCFELPECIDELIEQADEDGNMLAVISFGLRHAQYHDLGGWQDFISYLEQYWFARLSSYIKTGKLGKLVILTESQKFTLTKLSFYKIWKRRKSINKYID